MFVIYFLVNLCVKVYMHFTYYSFTLIQWGLFNSLWLSDAIWQHRARSILACFFTAPKHYLNQCWLIISRVQKHSSGGNFLRDTCTTAIINEICLKQIKVMSTSCEIALRWMSQNTFDEKSALVEVMACFCLAASSYLNQVLQCHIASLGHNELWGPEIVWNWNR